MSSSGNRASQAGRAGGASPARATAGRVRASFDRAAPEYERHAAVQAELAGWVAQWGPAVRTGDALEMGAGTGMLTRKFQPWTGRYLATDISPAMCRAGKAALPGVEWRPAAAEEPPAGPWDWIFSSGMLQWAADPAAMMAAWRGCLAPGGRVLAGLFAAGSLCELQEVLGGYAPLTWRTPEEWRQALAAGGLRLIRDGGQQRVVRHASALELMRAIHKAGAAPERRLATGRFRRMLGEYEQHHGSPRGGVGATWVFYRFEAVADVP